MALILVFTLSNGPQQNKKLKNKGIKKKLNNAILIIKIQTLVSS